MKVTPRRKRDGWDLRAAGTLHGGWRGYCSAGVDHQAERIYQLVRVDPEHADRTLSVVIAYLCRQHAAILGGMVRGEIAGGFTINDAGYPLEPFGADASVELRPAPGAIRGYVIAGALSLLRA